MNKVFGAVLSLLVSTSAIALPVAPIDSNRAYLIAAARYLNVQKDQGIAVKRAFTGLKTHDTTRTDFRRILKNARIMTSMEWTNNYVKTGQLAVPAAYADLDRSIQRSHDLRETAYKDWMGANGRPEKAEDATETFNTSLNAEQQAMGDLVDALKIHKPK